LGQDSTKQLFNKDYNWLGVFLNGLMQAKIRNEMIEGVSFFDSLSSEQHIRFPGYLTLPAKKIDLLQQDP
jgi:hypothetical protein